MHHRGFTLIELLVVLAIAALLIGALVASGLYGGWQRRSLDTAALELQAAIAGARDEAIRTGRPAGIRLLPDPAFPIHRLPDGRIDPNFPLVYNRWVAIAAAPDYTEGTAAPVQSGLVPAAQP
jgi:prepilin-type N-terminal cleavage/methylation domain-containing protein